MFEINTTWRWSPSDQRWHPQEEQVIGWEFDAKVGCEVMWWAWTKGRQPVPTGTGWYTINLDGVQYRARQCCRSQTYGWDPEREREMPQRLRRGRMQLGKVQQLLEDTKGE